MGTGPKVVKLTEPLEIESKEGKAMIAEIRVMGLKAKHLKVIPATMLAGKETNPAKLFPLLCALTGLSPEVLGELCFADFQTVVAAVTDRMGEAVAPDQTGST